jgi:hypothetical protein
MSAKDNKWWQDSVNEEKKVTEIGERITNLGEEEEEVTYFCIDNARVIYTKRFKFVKNKHARYTLESYER